MLHHFKGLREDHQHLKGAIDGGDGHIFIFNTPKKMDHPTFEQIPNGIIEVWIVVEKFKGDIMNRWIVGTDEQKGGCVTIG